MPDFPWTPAIIDNPVLLSNACYDHYLEWKSSHSDSPGERT